MLSLQGKTVEEARDILKQFLQETGTYHICAECPIYGPDGCCSGCSNLVRGKTDGSACQNTNLSCLSYVCNTLALYLSKLPSDEHGDKLKEFLELTYGMPREGYRGSQRRGEGELLQIEDPLKVVAEFQRENKVCSPSAEEKLSLEAKE